MSNQNIQDFEGSTDAISVTDSGLSTAEKPKRGFVSRFFTSLAPELDAAAERTSQVADGIQQVLPQVEDLINTFQMSSADISAASQSILRLTESVRAIVESIPALVSFATRVVDGVVWLYEAVVAWMQKNYFAIPPLLYRFFGIVGLAYPIAQQAINMITKLIVPKEPQQGLDGSVLLEPQASPDMLAHIVSIMLGTAILQQVPNEKELQNVNNKLRFKAMLANEIQTTTDMFISLLRKLPEEIQLWMQHLMPMRYWCSLFAPGTPYFQWIDEVDYLSLHENRARASYDVEMQMRIRCAYLTGKKLNQEIAMFGKGNMNVLAQLLGKSFKTIQELYDIVDISATQRAERPIPFVVYLVGRPGVGKSFLSNVIPVILAGANEETANLCWTRNPAIQHWDGYTGQYAIKYDDFAAIRNPNASPGEFGELMSAVSNAQFRLPMAGIPEKGETFRSRMIMITSNAAYPQPNDIEDRDALWRRRHFMCEVRLRPGYEIPGTSQVNPAMIDAENSQWIFQRKNPWRDESIGQPMNYRQFLRAMRQEYATHFRNQEISATNHLRMIREALGMANEPDDDQEEFFEAQGLFEDFTRITTMSAAAVLTGKAAEKAYNELIRVANLEQRCPRWDFLNSFVPLCTIFCASLSMWMASSYINRKQEEKRAAALRVMEAQDGKSIEVQEIERILRKSFVDLPEEDIQQIMAKIAKKKIKKQGAYSGVPTRTQQLVRVMRQAGCDDNAVQVVQHCVVPNLVRVVVNGLNLSGFFVKKRLLVVPDHLFVDMQGQVVSEGDQIIVQGEHAVFRFGYEAKRHLKAGTDIAFYDCPIPVREYKDVTNHFMSDDDLSFKKQFDALVVQLTPSGMPLTMSVPALGNTYPITYEVGNETKFYAKFVCWTYEANLGKGACGSVLVASSSLIPRKICGLHIAGANRTGVSHVITQEMVLAAVEHFRIIGGSGMKMHRSVQPTLEAARFVPQGNFTYLGTIPRKIHVSTNTKIVPSVIFDQVYPHTTEPSVLSPSDPRLEERVSPMQLGVEKYGQEAMPIDPVRLGQVVVHLSNMFQQFEGGLPREVVSEAVAINGDPTVEFADHLVMDTSPGYPFNQRPGCKGKSHLFQTTEAGHVIDDDELRKAMDLRWHLALKGERSPSLWVDTLKDERRKIPKIKAGKTRVFTIPPVDFTLVTRRLFLAFSVMFYRNRLKFFSAVGITPESIEWSILFRKLRGKSPTGFAGDYSSWDGTLHPSFIMGVCDVINAWYGDAKEYQLARQTIFEELIHTNQIAINIVYCTHIGNPSGNALTAQLNTMIGAMYMRYAWLELAPVPMRSLQHYEDNIEEAIYGDDIDIAVALECQTFFNPHDISRVFAAIGITFTSATKDGEATFQPIEQTTFLKRGFREGRWGVMLPTMDKDTIRELVNWIRISDMQTEDEAFVSNCNESFRFAFFHGPEYFQEHFDLVTFAAPRRLRNKFLDYAYFHQWFYSDIFQNAKGGELRAALPFLRERVNYPEMSQEKVCLSLQVDADGLTSEQRSPSSMVSRQNTAIMANDEINEEPVRMERQSNQVVNIENAKGVISMSQREIEENPDPCGVPQKTHANACIAEGPWSLTDMVHRRAFVGEYEWGTSQPAGTILQSFEVPKDLLVSFLQTAPFERFQFWSGSVRIIVQVNGTKFHAGKLILATAPFMNKADIAANYGESRFTAITCLEHQFVGAGQSNEAAVVVPFVNPKSFITLGDSYNPKQDFTGGVFLTVLVPLSAGTGTTPSISYSIWVEMCQDQRFQVPIHSKKVTMGFNPQHKQFIRRMYRQSGEDVPRRFEAQGNQISNTTTVQNFDKVNSQNLPTNITGDSIGNGNDVKASGLPMDKPAWTVNPMAMYRVPLQHLANTTGVECLTRLDLCGGTQNISDPETFGCKKDEMVLSSLLRRPTYVTQFLWNGNDTPGKSLFSGLLGPMAILYQPNGRPRDYTNEQEIGGLTLWEYNAMRFRFWSGGIKVRIDVVASQMHTGRLLVSCNYGATPDQESDLVDSASQYATILDVNNGNHSFLLEFPYKAATECLMMANGALETAQAPAIANIMRRFLGSWSIRVLGKLVIPNGCAPNVSIVISMAGADDFTVYYPDVTNSTIVPYINKPAVRRRRDVHITEEEEIVHMEAQAGNEEEISDNPSLTQDTVATNAVIVAPEQHLGPPFIRKFGKKATTKHIADVIKRYTIDNFFSVQDAKYINMSALPDALGATTFYIAPVGYDSGNMAQAYMLFTVVPVSPFDVVRASGPQGLLSGGTDMISHFGLQFRMWAGSIRYKFLTGALTIYPEDQTKVPAIKIQPDKAIATYLPHCIADLSTYTLVSLVSDTAFGMGDAKNFNLRVTSMANAYSDKNSPYLEIECPFTSMYQCLPLDSYGVGGQEKGEDRMAGTVIVTQLFTIPDSVTVPMAYATAITQGRVRSEMSVWKAAGDDFRFGNLVGIPRLKFKTVHSKLVVAPDTWSVAPAKAVGTSSGAAAATANKPPATAGTSTTNRPKPDPNVARTRATRSVRVDYTDDEDYDVLERQSGEMPMLFERQSSPDFTFGVRHFVLPPVLFVGAMTREVPTCSLEDKAQSALVGIMSMANIGVPLFRAYYQLKSKLGFNVWMSGYQEMDCGKTTVYWKELYWSYRLKSDNVHKVFRNWAPSTSIEMSTDKIELEDKAHERVLMEIALALRALIMKNYKFSQDPPRYNMEEIPTMMDEVRAAQNAAIRMEPQAGESDKITSRWAAARGGPLHPELIQPTWWDIYERIRHPRPMIRGAAKSMFNELKMYFKDVDYEISAVEMCGPGHNPNFSLVVTAHVGEFFEEQAQGIGTSKKIAEDEAFKEIFHKLLVRATEHGSSENSTIPKIPERKRMERVSESLGNKTYEFVAPSSDEEQTEDEVPENLELFRFSEDWSENQIETELALYTKSLEQYGLEASDARFLMESKRALPYQLGYFMNFTSFEERKGYAVFAHLCEKSGVQGVDPGCLASVKVNARNLSCAKDMAAMLLIEEFVGAEEDRRMGQRIRMDQRDTGIANTKEAVQALIRVEKCLEKVSFEDTSARIFVNTLKSIQQKFVRLRSKQAEDEKAELLGLAQM